jgi:hypothetical protein
MAVDGVEIGHPHQDIILWLARQRDIGFTKPLAGMVTQAKPAPIF